VTSAAQSIDVEIDRVRDVCFISVD
jgi:hypothetical protein